MSRVETQPDQADLSSKDALLDTAEQMFATAGFDGVSLRALTTQAGTNLAAVNYHFGSKEKLFEAVILRRVRPINERRVALLKDVLAEAGDGDLPLAQVLDAFARPFVVEIGSAGRESFRRIAVRLFMESDPLVKPIFEREFAPVGRRFRDAMMRACPGLTPSQVTHGFIFYLGAMINLLSMEKRMAKFMQSDGQRPNDEETLQSLIRFGIAGFAGLAADHSSPSAVGRRK